MDAIASADQLPADEWDERLFTSDEDSSEGDQDLNDNDDAHARLSDSVHGLDLPDTDQSIDEPIANEVAEATLEDEVSSGDEDDWEDDEDEDDELKKVNDEEWKQQLEQYLLLNLSQQPEACSSGFSVPVSSTTDQQFSTSFSGQTSADQQSPDLSALNSEEKARIDDVVLVIEQEIQQVVSRKRQHKLIRDLKNIADKIRRHRKLRTPSASEKRAATWIAVGIDSLLTESSNQKYAEILHHHCKLLISVILSNPDARADLQLICEAVWLTAFKHQAGKMSANPGSVAEAFKDLASPKNIRSQEWSPGRKIVYGWLFEGLREPHKYSLSMARSVYGGSTVEARDRKWAYDSKWRNPRKITPRNPYVYRKMIQYRKRTSIVSADLSQLHPWPVIQDLVMCIDETVFIIMFQSCGKPKHTSEYNPELTLALQSAVRQRIPDLPDFPLHPMNRCLPISQPLRVHRWTKPEITLLKQMYNQLKPTSAKAFDTAVKKALWNRLRRRRSLGAVQRIRVRLGLFGSWGAPRNFASDHKKFQSNFDEIEHVVERLVEGMRGMKEDAQATALQRSVLDTFNIDLTFRVARSQIVRVMKKLGISNDQRWGASTRKWTIRELDEVIGYLEALEPKDFSGIQGSSLEINEYLGRKAIHAGTWDCRAVLLAPKSQSLLPKGDKATLDSRRRQLANAIKNVKEKRERAGKNAEGLYIAVRAPVKKDLSRAPRKHERGADGRFLAGGKRPITLRGWGPGESAVLIQVVFEFIAVRYAELDPAELGISWEPTTWWDLAKETKKRLDEKYPGGYQDGLNLEVSQIENKITAYRGRPRNFGRKARLEVIQTPNASIGLFVDEVVNHLVARLQDCIGKGEIETGDAIGWLLQQDWEVAVTCLHFPNHEESDDEALSPEGDRTDVDEREGIEAVDEGIDEHQRGSAWKSQTEESAPSTAKLVTDSETGQFERPKRKAASTVNNYFVNDDWATAFDDDADDENVKGKKVLQPRSGNVQKKQKTKK